MKLIVGLGNPGAQYEGTRHNVGFEVLALLAKQFAAGIAPRARFQGEVIEATIHGQKSLLLTPLTYMNLSGASVLAARDFYKIENQEILIVCDDFQLPLAKLRFRASGSAGGQNGLADVIHRLGTEDIPRLRIGIGPPPPGREATGHVLGRFTKEERLEIVPALSLAAQGAADWALHDLKHCMNQYNA
ncbi:MAG: aminoacyl-tRNA hydrolase [Planctomycetaceae bacterium]|nr:aminoacyl-tRNA hydrolase [Planctomycetaceae bacterium]